MKLEIRQRPRRLEDPDELGKRRRGIVHVAQEVGEGDRVEVAAREGEDLRSAQHEPNRCTWVRGLRLDDASTKHLLTLVEPHDRGAGPGDHLPRDHAGPGRDIEHPLARSDPDP